jgi:hypothetical protein
VKKVVRRKSRDIDVPKYDEVDHDARPGKIYRQEDRKNGARTYKFTCKRCKYVCAIEGDDDLAFKHFEKTQLCFRCNSLPPRSTKTMMSFSRNEEGYVPKLDSIELMANEKRSEKIKQNNITKKEQRKQVVEKVKTSNRGKSIKSFDDMF